VRHTSVYRKLVTLYPKAFRREFGGDLVQHFDDLLVSHGAARTWQRTAVDLAVTVPRYRLETLMSPHRTDTTLYCATIVVALLAALGITTGFFAPGLVLLLTAGVLIVVSWSRLARSTRAPDRHRRRRLLITAAVLATIWLVTTAASWIELSTSENWHGGKLVIYNAVFFVTAISALVCLVVGLRTPRNPRIANPL
jgi:hypothetical protein